MMTGTMLKAWKTVKNHVPLIKFRKGGSYRDSNPSPSAPSGGGGKAGGSTPSGNQPVIEDWQLPGYYRRAPLDDKEIDSINSGGAY